MIPLALLAIIGLGLKPYPLGAQSYTADFFYSGTVNVICSKAHNTTHRRNMQHGWLKMRDAFPKSADEYTQSMEKLLQRNRADMDEAWAKLEEGCATTDERTVRFGLVPKTDDEGVIKLNVGGSSVIVCWNLLVEAEGFKDSVLFAFFEGIWGKGRIPRDADGRIVLDESPVGIRHIMETVLTSRMIAGVAARPSESAAHSAVAFDEVPCLIYTAHVMGLPGYVPTHPRYLKMNGGSTVLEPFEIAPLGATIREWVGSSTEEMTLIYRATRDGFDTKSFKPACNEDTTSHVVSLIRVSSGKGNDADDSVVGGYSVLAWGKGTKSKQTIAEETFVFMLKDGSATRKDPNKPTKWSPYPKQVGYSFTTLHESNGAVVGGADVFTSLHRASGGWVLATGRKMFDIEEDSSFLALNGNNVVDIEVYRCSTPDPPTTTAPITTNPGGDALIGAEVHDTRSFGQSIASLLMRERVVLDRAVKEMEEARARVSAAIGALETVHGPSVAAGEQDGAVELNVRGTRMTTLRSTLQACPSSALATMFNEEKWPATDKDIDEQGRRLIDCNTTCFSKILDVLRMRKRASWSRGVERGGKGEEKEEEKEEEQEEEEKKKEKEEEEEEEEEAEGEKGEGGGQAKNKDSGIGGSGAVLIKEADAEAFGEAVNMYFPGCESFIMDMVQTVQPDMDIHTPWKLAAPAAPTIHAIHQTPLGAVQQQQQQQQQQALLRASPGPPLQQCSAGAVQQLQLQQRQQTLLQASPGPPLQQPSAGSAPQLQRQHQQQQASVRLEKQLQR